MTGLAITGVLMLLALGAVKWPIVAALLLWASYGTAQLIPDMFEDFIASVLLWGALVGCVAIYWVQ